MGYTHYFQQNTAVSASVWAKIVKDVRSLLDASPVTICNGSGDADSQPELENDAIVFNGEGDDAHESFWLPRQSSDFNFCKTARKPYDLLCVAALCVADFHAPNAYDISSDGDRDEWSDGLKFAQTTLNNSDLQIPLGV